MSGEYINKQKQVQKIEITQELYNKQQEEAWNLVNTFGETTSVKDKKGSKKAKYDAMNISELRDQLLSEKGSKSETFNLMANEVDWLLKLSATKGTYNDSQLGQTKASFYDTFYKSKEAVNRYIFMHSGYHLFDKGDRRYQIALRIKSLLNEMERQIDEKTSSLNAKEARMAGYKSKGYTEEQIKEAEKAFEANAFASDAQKLIETGSFGPQLPQEELDKSLNTWAVKDYSDYLSKLVEGKKLTTKDDKNDFIAFMEDKNSRLLANKIAFPMVLDRRVEITLGMPWLRDELSEHIQAKAKDEDFFLKPEDFVKKLNQICDDFMAANADHIAKYASRRALIFNALKLSETSGNIYRYSAMELMITTKSDEQFNAILAQFINSTKEIDDLLEEKLKKKCSEATRDKVREKLYKHLGSLRVFGSNEQVLTQADMFFEMLQYVSPDEQRVERQLRKLLDDFELEDSYRDVFLKAITASNPTKFLEKDNKHWKSEGKKVAERIRKNRESAQKLMEKNGLLLTQGQWIDLEEKAISASAAKNGDFIKSLNAIAVRKLNEKKLSLREYREKKSFDDENKLPSAIKKTEIEQKRLDNIGDKLDKKFLVHLAGNGDNIYLPYRGYSMAYKNQSNAYKQQEKLENIRYEDRQKDLKPVLLAAGIRESEVETYCLKFKWFMSGLTDITDDMSPDMKLVCLRRNIERFGVKSWKEALTKIAALGSNIFDINNHKEVKDAKELYDQGIKTLETYGGEKYKELIPFIINIPEVYAEMLKGEKSFKDFIATTLDVKLADFMEGCNKAGKHDPNYKGKVKFVISGAARQQYAHMFIRGIYEGTLSGDSDFYANQLDEFQKKLFSISAPDGISVNKALELAEKVIDKKIKKEKIDGQDGRLLRFSALQEFYAKVETMEGIKEITNAKACEEFVSQKFDELRSEIKSNKKEKELKEAISLTMDWEIFDKDVEEAKDDIEKKKEEAKLERLKYLRTNDYVLDEVRQGKTLIRVSQKGQDAITLDKSRIDKMRGRVDRYCDELQLPQILKDALIEHGASGGIVPGITDTYGNSELLFNHAVAMKRMYDLLRTDRVGDKGLGEEEAMMFIVRSYGNTELVKNWFDKPEKIDVETIREGPYLKIFRADYEKLVKFEEKASDDPSLQQEIHEISRNIRTMLITGMGIRDEKNKTVAAEDADTIKNMQRVGIIIEKSSAYIDYWNKVMEVARPEFIRIFKESADPSMKNKDLDIPADYVDRLMFSLRQYFMTDVLEELNNKKAFKAEFWKNKLEIFKKKEYRDNLYSQSQTVTQKETEKKEQSALNNNAVDESAISKLIKANLYVFKGKANKYDALSVEEKQLFAIGLMYLDKSAIGLGTEGTMALTESMAQKNKKRDDIHAEIQKFIRGEKYNFNINYRDALNKLIDYGISSIGTSDYKMSETAYEKAMQFTKGVMAQKNAYGEKDEERLSDSYASVFAGYTKFGKKQLTNIDALRGRTLTVDDIKKNLIEYATKDKLSKAAVFQKALKATKSKFYLLPGVIFPQIGAVEQSAAWNNRLSKIISRFNSMSDGDLKIFVRILQDRTAVDVSCIQTEGSPLHADQEKRNALLEALSGDPDTSAEVLEGFDDSESCFKALTTALSFQLRDDKNFAGKELTKDCFEKKSFNRNTMVDWDLIERAFEFFDEIMEKKTNIEALKNSGELIKYAGNEKAAIENKYLRENYANKADFKQQNFEHNINEHAKRDNANDDRKDIDNALAGYYALTDQQKVLFFKALCSRDILDISKKDYKKNFFNIKDRDYVNPVARDKLIDQYIAANIEDNIGLKLEDDEYYKAMEALYSTQISDRVKLTKEKDLGNIFSNERNLFMKRSTAVDWKLFKRALNFVNRATEELELTEGNALLYRGAGDLQKNGRINMNYGFLRKNFHRTGGQWGRLFAYKGTSAATKAFNLDKKGMNTLKKITNAAGDATKVLGFSDSGYLKSGIKTVKETSKEYEGHIKKISKNDEETYEKFQKKIDDIINKNKTVETIVDNLKKYVNTEFGSYVDTVGSTLLTKEKSDAPDEENIIEKNAKDVVLDAKKGDIRDDYNDLNKKLKQTKKIANAVGMVNDKILTKIPVANAGKFLELMEYTVEKAVYKFANDKVFKAAVDTNEEDQLKALKEAIDNYVSETFEETMKDLVGKGNTEKIQEYAKMLGNFKKNAAVRINSALRGVQYVKKAVDNVVNIANYASNISAINQTKEQSENLKASDKAKLDKAKNRSRLDEKQLGKAKIAADKNQGMTEVAASISKTMQELGIGENAIKLAVRAVSVAVDGTGVTSEVINKVVSAGLSFAKFAIRIFTDQSALRDYYVKTDAGKREVEKIKSGYEASGKTKLLNKFKKEIDPKTASNDLVGMMAQAKGYEDTAELVENTGMSMAQSIIFSASEFNPMGESKVMAITVMSVMGLEHLIGDTSTEAVEQLFGAFKMKR